MFSIGNSRTLEIVAPANGTLAPAAPGVLRRTIESLRDVAPLKSLGTKQYACAVTRAALERYWGELQAGTTSVWCLPPGPTEAEAIELDPESQFQAEALGRLASEHEPVIAGYLLGELYTSLLPQEHRAQHGVYYTPPALTARLLMLAHDAGVDWTSCRVLDPACGGGAFLTPAALAIVASLAYLPADQLIDHLASHLSGLELDPFGAWMSHALLEAALLPLCKQAGRRLPLLVRTCDTLHEQPERPGYDLVIGNPPFGRVTLSPALRRSYQRSLYGHANLYGIFLDVAIRWTRPRGVIAYITPTGFLGGQYFRALRSLLAREAPPQALDLVTSRKDVFADVLQETLLGAYQVGGRPGPVTVHVLSLLAPDKASLSFSGEFTLPAAPKEPWLVPRSEEQHHLIARMQAMPHRLRDYGYAVSTGPLVWNRHRHQLSGKFSPGAVPVIWSECVTADGRFVFRTEKKNHVPFLRPGADQGWLIIREPCVLVQRTTAKEQRRRLLAAELPEALIRQYGAVSVENHLNMVRRAGPAPLVPPKLVARLLNSAIVDSAFRCINGSVAVSASELEALPLPPPEAILRLEALLGANQEMDFAREVRQLYLAE